MKTSELNLAPSSGLEVDALALCRAMGLLDATPMVDFDTVTEPWSWRKDRFTPRELAELWSRHLTRPDVSPTHPLVLYLHVPFCTHACSYCRCFRLQAGPGDLLETYVTYLCDQIDFFGPRFADVPVRVFSMGGGTPSLLSPAQLTRVFQRLRERFRVEADHPMNTIEVTLPSMHDATLEALVANAIPRVSIGVQTLRPEIRRANAMFPITRARLSDRIAKARALGLHVNADLILGLSGESASQFLDGFDAVLDQHPSSIIVNILHRDDATRPTATDARTAADRAHFLAEVAAGMMRLADAAGYAPHPHSNSLESIGFLSPEFEPLFERYYEEFKRLASGVVSVRVGTSVFSLGSICNLGLLPDYLISSFDQTYVFDPDKPSYQCSRKEVFSLLYPTAEDRGVPFASAATALLDRALPGFAADEPAVEVLRAEDEVLLQFADSEQAEGTSRAFVRPAADPRVRFKTLGPFAIAYNGELTPRMRQVLTRLARRIVLP